MGSHGGSSGGGSSGRAAVLGGRGGSRGSGGLANGVKFVKDPRAAMHGDRVVLASVSKLNASLAKDVGYHVGVGGVGKSAKGGAYANANAFLRQSQANGQGVHMTRTGIDKQGNAYITDGRHRFAALRDSGAKVVPVTVHKSEYATFKKAFGARTR